MRLARALRVKAGQRLAFVGAGGKTSAMRRLARELASEMPVIISTTTRLGIDQIDVARGCLSVSNSQDLEPLPELLSQYGSVLISAAAEKALGKLPAPPKALIDDLARWSEQLGAVLLIEADGARGRSLKAPAAHEPVIPDWIDLLVPIAALDVLDQPLDSDRVHRPERVAALLEVANNHRLQESDLARLLAHPRGGLAGAPENVPVRVLLNKIDSPARLKAGRTIAELLSSESRVQAVVLAALRADPPVLEVYLRQAAVILAAGGSSRLGQPKQLVLWRGRPLVWHAARAALGAGLDPVIVVVGAHAADVRAALDSLPVSVVENPNWRSGQSSSVKAGLAVVREAEATVFLLTDTPYVDSDLVAALSEAHRKSLAPIVAPRAAGRRANPVLFDRLTYPALFQIEGDQGGRDLFDRFEVHWVDWQAEILLDVDDQADLARMKAQDRAHDSRQES